MEFNLLPLEVRLGIFSYLPVPEVMKIRLVCKQWKHLINSEFKFQQLLCRQQNVYSRHLKSPSDFRFASAGPFLTYASNDRKFRRIKYLLADLRLSPTEVNDAFEFLNSFKSLRKAMFSCDVQKNANERNERGPMNQLVVNLDHLEMLDFQLNIDPPVSVLLSLPSLHYLGLTTFRAVTVGHPDKLRTLLAERFIQEGPDYSTFTSLTKIYASLHDVRLISASFIVRVPSLREIHLKDDYDFECFRSFGGDKEEPSLPSDQEKARIFYFGVEISLDELNSEAEHLHEFRQWAPGVLTTELIVRNRHTSVDSNQLVTSIYYNSVADQLNDEQMFGVMFQKFPNIRDIKIRGNVADENRLLKFLGHFEVRRLLFMRTSLSRSFFDKLAKICPLIQLLSVHKQSSMDILSGDLDFIFKFENVGWLYLYGFQLSLNFVTRLLKGLKSIVVIRFNEYREDRERYNFELSAGGGLRLSVDGSHFKPLDRDRNWKSSQERDWTKSLLKFVNDLNNRLKVDGYVCPKKLLTILRQIDIEEQNCLFMMRQYVYEQRHSIGMPKELMRLLN